MLPCKAQTRFELPSPTMPIHMKGRPHSTWVLQDKQVYLVWAESVEGIKVSPSLLLAFVLLMVQREAAMFLRMATGFGFAQVGDYTASLFYLFRSGRTP